MCYGNAAKSLEIARSRLTPEQWQRFEREFDDFCVVQGLVKPPEHLRHVRRYTHELLCAQFDWARWAFFQGRQYAEMEALIEDNASLMDSLTKEANARCAVEDAYFEKIAIAMMSDEQAVASLERWKLVNLERGA